MKARAGATAGFVLGLLLACLPAAAGVDAAAPDPGAAARHGGASQAAPVPEARNGLSIHARFREGLAQAQCAADTSPRWRRHFAETPDRLAAGRDESLELFGYVLDAVHAAHLPSEYALIPFIESGYRADARSPSGPVGMWQMITITARNHRVPIRAGYDGRLSPVDSTRAAVRYLKTLHGMFAGDWRLAAMAYNAGEYRILGALRRSGQQARDVRMDQLQGVPATSRAYVAKLQALTCVLLEADADPQWLQAMERPVERLEPVEVPPGIHRVRDWASRHGQDAERLRRLNPVHAGGRIARPGDQPARLLAVAPAVPAAAQAPAGAAGGGH